MTECAAYFQRPLKALQAQIKMTTLIASSADDVLAIDDDASMYLNEVSRIYSQHQLAQTHAQQSLPGFRHHVHVFLSGLEADDIGHRNHSHGIADTGPNDLNALRNLVGRQGDRLHSLHEGRHLPQLWCSDSLR